MTTQEATCARCEGVIYFTSDFPPNECAVCVKLGDRSLLWYMRAVREGVPDRRARFDAAVSRSAIDFEAGREAMRR